MLEKVVVLMLWTQDNYIFLISKSLFIFCCSHSFALVVWLEFMAQFEMNTVWERYQYLQVIISWNSCTLSENYLVFKHMHDQEYT